MKTNKRFVTESIKGRKLLITGCVALLVLIILLFQELAFRANSKKLNLVIISIDTLRPDHMGVYGYKKNTTPNIDNLAKKATVFTNVTTVVPMTHPSFAALFTGYDPFKTRIIINEGLSVGPNTKTLATRLREAGYLTSAFIPILSALNQGFDVYKPYSFKGAYLVNNSEFFNQTDRAKYEQYLKSAQKWITDNKDKKFFTWIHLMDVHPPYFPPEDMRCKFNSKFCPQINNKSLEDLEKLRAEQQQCQNTPPSKDRVELMETLYDGGVATADKLVGEFLDTLKKNGLDKNTIVVIYGDHGEGFDHNYYFMHREVLYNSAISIPLVIYDPLSPSGQVSNILLQNTDIMPTILDLLRVPHESTLSKDSFSPTFNPNILVRLSQQQLRKYSFSANISFSKFSVSDGNYKYILSLPSSCINNGQSEELYDLKVDLNEKKNIINTNKKVGDNLRSVLLEYLSQYNLPQISKQGYDLSNDSKNKVNKLDNNIRSLGY